jgi:hypothetical protein
MRYNRERLSYPLLTKIQVQQPSSQTLGKVTGNRFLRSACW